MPALRVLLTILFLAAPQLVLAQGGPNLTGAQAGPYAVDKKHASIIFRVDHMGYALYQARFNTFDAKINLDPKNPEKSTVEATIDVGSVDANDEAMEKHLRNADFFDAEKFPQAKFKSTKVTKTGADTGTIEGDLTMHGVTHPVTLNVLFHGYGPHPKTKTPTIGFGATGKIKRSQWGMNFGVPMVGDDVMLQIEGEFNYAGTPPAESAAPKSETPAPAAPASKY
jgi:polyisoprenoid-binding protein YceI